MGVLLSLLFGGTRIGRGPIAAVLIFAGVLVPVLGFFNVYFMQFSQVADHFQYHASLALIALAAAGVMHLGGTWIGSPTDPDCARLVALLLFALGVVTFQRTLRYQNEEAFYRDILAENPAAWVARQNLGARLHVQGQFKEALSLYATAIARIRMTRCCMIGAGDPVELGVGATAINLVNSMMRIPHFRKACLLEPLLTSLHG